MPAPQPAFMAEIDWKRPWLATVQPVAAIILAEDVPWRAALNAAAAARKIFNHRGLPLRFIPQEELPAGKAYEAHISDTGCVPTRDNLHDWFNALVWLTFPKIKVALNRLQAAEIFRAAPDGHVTSLRGSLRDGATIFDENAAIFVHAEDDLEAALRQHRWMEAFQVRRADWSRSADAYLFGHALMEKLVHPYKAITAHTWHLRVDRSFFALPRAQQFAEIDSLVSAQLQDGMSTRDFTPLPVLGVPDWWPGQDEAFYADTQVFRPPKQRVK